MGNEWKCRIQPPFLKKNKNKNKPRKQTKGRMTRRLFGLKVEPMPPTLAHLPCWATEPAGSPTPVHSSLLGTLSSYSHHFLYLSLFPRAADPQHSPCTELQVGEPQALGGTL